MEYNNINQQEQTNQLPDMEKHEQHTTEEPIIIIERVDDPADRVITIGADGGNEVRPSNRKWAWLSIAIVVAALIVAGAMWYRWYYHRYIDVGVPISRTPQEVVALFGETDSAALAQSRVKPEVIVSHDSILGVAMDLYELRGLHGEVVMQEPDTLDTDVVFYSRCADYEKNDKPIGSLVSKGKLIREDDTRLGYCGMVADKTLIGVSRYEDVRDYCAEAGGSFFRQFILVSGGELPPRFHLHGKVERRALARTADDRLYYVQTLYPEVMTGFADALREYGFVDAIYITGGKDYCYYRTRDGKRHDIGDVNTYPHKKQGIVPWMVFRKK